MTPDRPYPAVTAIPIPVTEPAPRAEPPQGLPVSSVGLVRDGVVTRADLTARMLCLVMARRVAVRPTTRRTLLGGEEYTWEFLPGPTATGVTTADEALALCLTEWGAGSTLAEERRSARGPLGEMRQQVDRETEDGGWVTPAMKLWRGVHRAGMALASCTVWIVMSQVGDVSLRGVVAAVVCGILAAVCWIQGRDRLAGAVRGRPRITAREIHDLTVRLGEAREPEFTTRHAGEHFSRYLPWAIVTGTRHIWERRFVESLPELRAGDPFAEEHVRTSLAWFTEGWTAPRDLEGVLGELSRLIDDIYGVVDSMFDAEEARARRRRR